MKNPMKRKTFVFGLSKAGYSPFTHSAHTCAIVTHTIRVMNIKTIAISTVNLQTNVTVSIRVILTDTIHNLFKSVVVLLNNSLRLLWQLLENVCFHKACRACNLTLFSSFRCSFISIISSSVCPFSRSISHSSSLIMVYHQKQESLPH